MSNVPTYEELIKENESLKKINEELKQEKFELISNSRHLQNLYDTAPVGIFIFDENAIITHCNDFFVEIIGSSKETLIGFNMKERLQNEELKFEILKTIETGEGCFEGIYKSVTADKSTPVNIILRRFVNDFIYGIGVVIDITDENAFRNQLVAEKEKAKHKEENLRELLDASPDLISFKDGEGRWLESNTANSKLFNLSDIDCIGKTDNELIEYSPEFEVPLLHCAETDEYAWEKADIFHTEETVKLADGNEKVFDIIKKPIFYENGDRKALIIIGRDVTEKKIIEKRIKENEKNLQTLMNNLPGIVYRCLTTPNWPMMYLSKGVTDITGYTPEEFLNNEITFDELIIPQDKKKVWAVISQANESTVPFQVKYTISDKYGNYKYLLEQGQKVGVNEDGINIIEGFITDLTKQYEFENKLKESEQKYRTLIEKSQDAIFIMDPLGYVQEANKKALDMLGYTKSEMLGISFEDVVVPKQHENSIQILYKLRKEEDVPIYEKTFKTKKGKLLSVEISAALINDSSGNELLVSIVRDITDRKIAENALIKAKEKAEESDRLKSAFLANMSHEIRTPMNGILGFTQLLKDDDVTKEEKREYLGIINTNSQHLLKLIDDIINIAKIEANQLKINVLKFDVNIIMKEIFSTFNTDSLTLLKKDVKLINDVVTDEHLYMLSDPTRVKQILSNLIKNAVKFTEKGYVKYGYEIKGDLIEFYVKDTGIGIPASKGEMIFERFSQAESNFASKYGGTGLGLSICKGLVDLMGGNIWFDSGYGIGSTFYFSLPYDKTDSKGAEKRKEELKSLLVNWKARTVLIAEDNLTNYILLERMLRPSQINIVRATNGKEALDIYTEKQKDIDIILMDIKMPVLDGYLATQEIRKFDNEVPVIAVTAYAMHGDQQKSELAGCNDYLPKPLQRERLLRIMSEYLG